MHTPYILTASAHFKSIYNPWHFSSDLSSYPVTTSLPLGPLLIFSVCAESIFHEATEISWQPEEQGSWEVLLAPMRRRRARGRDGLMEGRENQRAEKAVREGELEGVPTCERFIDFQSE